MIRLTVISIVIFVFGCGLSVAQDPPPTDPIIDSVEIHNYNIYDTSNPDYSHWIFSLANHLHVPTHKNIVKRELLLGKGDRFNKELAEETARNLRSLPFIWNARADLIKGEDGSNILRVSTIDRWSLTGGPAINRVSGQTTFKIGAKESNFLGFGQTVAFDYFFRNYDEDYFVAKYYDRRLFGQKLALNIFINDDPEIGTKAFTLLRPYYSLNSNHTFYIDYTSYDYRNDYYRDGAIVGRDQIQGSKFSASITRRWGSYHTKFFVGPEYAYTDLENVDSSRFADDAEIVYESDSLYHFAGGTVGLEDIRYARTRRINMFTRDEDVTLVKGLAILYGRAWQGGSGKNIYDILGIQINLGVFYRSNLIQVESIVKRWFHEDRSLRKLFDIQVKYYNNSLSWYTLAVYLHHTRDSRIDGLKELYLGENNGIRGYPKNYSNGEKYIILNLENRFFTNLKFSASRISPVQFVDIGSTWNRGDDFDVRQLEWSVGVGLRISTERLASREAARIDLAYAGELKTWQISFGLGQYLN